LPESIRKKNALTLAEKKERRRGTFGELLGKAAGGKNHAETTSRKNKGRKKKKKSLLPNPLSSEEKEEGKALAGISM